MTGRCAECGHDPSSDELERRCEQLEEENRRLRERERAGQYHIHQLRNLLREWSGGLCKRTALRGRTVAAVEDTKDF